MATDAQVQGFFDIRIRPHMERLRAVIAILRDDKAALDAVYAYLNGAGSGWTDARTDVATPAVASDFFAFNALTTELLAAFDASTSKSVVARMCVRPLEVTV